jgi:glycosyltransferase involved in cell wall biosynthesis
MGEGNGKEEVLFAWPYLEWGGAQIYFMGIMKLARERYDVRALMPSGSSESLLGYLDQLKIPYEFFDAHMELGPATTVAARLRRRFRKARTEIVVARHVGKDRLRRSLLHMDFGPWSSFWLLLYLSLRRHVFVTLHTPLPQLSPARLSVWKAKFTILSGLAKFHLLASNREMVESLSAFVSTDALKRIRLAYSGIDRSEIDNALANRTTRDELLGRLGISPARFLVFAMGQFIDRKGCWIFLEAARTLSGTNNDIGFVWLGTESLSEETRRRVEQYGLDDSFRFLDSEEIGQTRRDLLNALRVADVFVLPSFTEGLPVALLEAMALGIPCIASNVNAIPEAVTDNETGILIPPGDSSALVAAIGRLRANDVERETIAKAGRSSVLARFDERQTAQITIDVYDTCFS